VTFESVVAVVVIALDGHVLDHAVHPLDLPVGAARRKAELDAAIGQQSWLREFEQVC
jgi:hypothetical protein